MPEDAIPLHYLQLFITIDHVDELCKQINDYGKMMKQKHRPLTKASTFKDSTDVGRYEIYKFFAVLIMIGTNPRPYILDSTKKHGYTAWFSQMFKRQQFQLLYHSMLHVCEPDSQGKAKIDSYE